MDTSQEFSDENDNNLKCDLIIKTRSVKLYYPERYAKILAAREIINGQLFKLSVDKLQELVEELKKEAKDVQG